MVTSHYVVKLYAKTVVQGEAAVVSVDVEADPLSRQSREASNTAVLLSFSIRAKECPIDHVLPSVKSANIVLIRYVQRESLAPARLAAAACSHADQTIS